MATRFHTAPTKVNAKTLRAFHRDLLRWYRRHHRPLPWRATRDPYKIWVSEIMLQQTRVDVVGDYYRRWLQAFPTVAALARAPYSRVLKLWEGLGYYTRAQNLHRAAKIVAATGLPRTAEHLQTLPGIGRYTAGAIASIAFGQRVPLVDGNVARVFARVFNIRANIKTPATHKQLWSLAETLLPASGCGDFNQALMELGALICTPAKPRCAVCPLQPVCQAPTDALPNRGRATQPVAVTHDVALMRRDGRVLLRRRPATGLLAGLWELPPLAGRTGRLLRTLRHTITNRRITLRVFACPPDERDPSGRWVSPAQLARLALPAAHRRALVSAGPESGSRSRASV